MHQVIRAVFVGDGSLLIRCAEAFRAAGHEVAAVASRQASILDWARSQGLPCEYFDQAPRFDGLDFDYLFSVANLQVLPAPLVRRAKRLALNFHDGPLPMYAGLNASAWAVIQGERRHGVVWHEMTEAVDRGRIAAERTFELDADETAFSLNARCYEVAFQAFVGLLGDIGRGTVALRPQEGEGTSFGRHARPEALATLDWRQDAPRLASLVRGLDFGTYANPLACPKAWLGDGRLVLARSAQAVASGGQAPGTVLEASGDRLRVATADGALQLGGCRLADGAPLPPIASGTVLPALPAPLRERLQQAAPRLARGEVAWREALRQAAPLELPYPRLAGAPSLALSPLRLPLSARDQGAATLAAFAGWLAALSGQARVSLWYADAALADAAAGLAPWAGAAVPVSVEVAPELPASQARARAEALVAQARAAGPLTCDLRWRLGEAAPALPRIGLTLGGAAAGLPLELRLLGPGDGALALELDPATWTPAVAGVVAAQLDAWLQAFAGAQAPLAQLPLVPADEAARWASLNETAVRVDVDEPVHLAIARAAARQADAQALRWHDVALTHAQLQSRAQALARVLRARGVGPGDIVGVCLPRTPDLLVSVLAVLHCGAAYLPLDPDYPAERVRYMLADSGARCVVGDAAAATLLALSPQQRVAPDAAAPEGDDAPLPAVAGDAAAYVIYTSGSTGRPKGVVVTHANVRNFFAGMDARVPHEGGGRWLAVTSLSFDIAVLELLWTLTRGFTVVLYAPQGAAVAARPPQFSLFYFASEATTGGSERYRLLMEGARFADAHGFEAVWTPERHFHAFGGPYPNPAVASAAIAAITTRVKIRAGSCVLPLHHPLRIAEEWALVDNLSDGRVGISFAAGWQPRDFVLRPEAFAQRKQAMLEGVDTVRRLWRGEALEFPGADGKPIATRTLPRPVQPELPVWLTAAANPETFEQAGRAGCHLLTHLLGQTVEDVAAKVTLYREAWRAAGHAGQGTVTVMLHTFVGDDEDEVREVARGPMKSYLRSSVDLIRQAAWSFPTFVQRAAADGRTPVQVMESQPLSESELDALLDHAFSRYWQTSSLIGTPERCLQMVHRLQDAGVDEIACLIDFGIPTDTALAHLPDLRGLMHRAQRPRRAGAALTVSGELRRHRITHLQCTPSMASILAADAEGRAGLSGLAALLVGGEALPLPLARELRRLVPGKLLNMYGPTETTVWSTCCDLEAIDDFVPLGPPIANTWLRVRNAWGQECPALVPGELLIGGAGVTRGYLGRPELTDERFIDDPQRPGARLYRTGDLVRRHPDGRLEFLGRLDHQVKIRGHRIELGEIENALARQDGVKDAVVVAVRDAAGEAFLLGYVTPRAGQAAPQPEALAQALAAELPEVMRPKAILVRDALPLTPNGKVDRKALAPSAPVAARAPSAPPASGVEQTVAAIWQDVLGRADIPRDANFFDLGGHSLLVIQVQRRLREATGIEVPVTDMFRLTTVCAIARHLQAGGEAAAAPPAVVVGQAVSRAQARRALRSAEREGAR